MSEPEAGAITTTRQRPPLPWVRASSLRLFDTIVDELGGDADRLLHAHGLSRAILSNPGGIILIRQMIRLLDHSANDLGCPDLGMRVAMRQRAFPLSGAIELTMRNSETLANAFRFVTNHTDFYAPTASLSFHEQAPGAARHLRYDLHVDGVTATGQVVEMGCLKACYAAGQIAGVRPSEIWLDHQPVAPMRCYIDNFGAPVVFGRSKNAIWFRAEDWDRRLERSETTLRELGEFALDQHRIDPLIDQVIETIRDALPQHRCTFEFVAGRIGLAPRTLRRFLNAHDLVFENMKDAIRKDSAATALTTTSVPIADIGRSLGYRSAASFARTSKRWFEASPTAFRRIHGSDNKRRRAGGAGEIPG